VWSVRRPGQEERCQEEGRKEQQGGQQAQSWLWPCRWGPGKQNVCTHGKTQGGMFSIDTYLIFDKLTLASFVFVNNLFL
jgi:hypothetical protein